MLKPNTRVTAQIFGNMGTNQNTVDIHKARTCKNTNTPTKLDTLRKTVVE